MNPSVFKLSRLEFRRVDIEANPDFSLPSSTPFFPQIDFDFNKVQFDLGTDLIYPDDELEDPRHFTLALKLSIQQNKQVDNVVIPYSVIIEGSAYLFYRGKDEGLRRFQVVRGTGYLMLYNAFREYVANFTSRSLHGLWFLPTPNFNSRVELDAPKDFEKWELEISNKSTPQRKRRSPSRNKSELNKATRSIKSQG